VSAAARISKQLAVLKKLMDQQDKLMVQLVPIKEKIEALRERLLKDFTAAELSSTTAAGLRVTRSTTPVPSLVDRIKFFAYASRKANWDLLQGSVAVAAWRERMDAGKAVPGVKPFNRVGLTVTRIKGRKDGTKRG
jgi:hypothetical protein